MIVIRTAHRDEYELVGRVTYQGFGHGSDEGNEPAPDRLALLLDAEARAVGGDLLVALDESGSIVGTASLLRSDSPLSRQAVDGEAELRLLAVLPSARRQGAGVELMREAIDRATTWGARALVLDTGSRNLRSQRLYHSLGFDRTPERESLISSSGTPLAVFRLPFAEAHGLTVRLARRQERAKALGVRANWTHQASPVSEVTDANAPTADGVRDDSGIGLGDDARNEDIDVWRVEERGDARPRAIVLTHRLRLPESGVPSPEPASPSDALAPVNIPVVIDPAAESARVHSAITRLLDVLAHGGLAIPDRPRVGAPSA